MLGISVISGFLFTQRLRTSVDITKSTRAIYAADAGIEAQLYDIFRGGYNGPNPGYESQSSEPINRSNIPGGAEFESNREYSESVGGFILSSTGSYEDSRSKVSRQLRIDLRIFGAE